MPELDYAILADHVRAERGVAYMIAGSIDTIFSRRVPVGQNVGLLLRVTFTQNECGRPHRIEVFCQDEDGERLANVTGTITPERDDSLPPGWDTGALLGLNFGIPLPRYGVYAFEILVDDRSVKSLRLRVLPVEGSPATEEG